MYPTLVFVLVNSQRTLDQMYSMDDFVLSAGQPAREATLRFAPPDLATNSDSGILTLRIEKHENSGMAPLMV